MDWSVVTEVLIASGFFAGVPQMVRWVRSHRSTDEQRAQAREDLSAAKMIQGISIDLLRPLHDQLDEANRQLSAANQQVRELRAKTDDINAELRTAREDVHALVTFSRRAIEVIEQHHLAVPSPIPPQIRRIH